MVLFGKEYTKLDVGWGFAPDPIQRPYCAHPDLLAGVNVRRERD